MLRRIFPRFFASPLPRPPQLARAVGDNALYWVREGQMYPMQVRSTTQLADNFFGALQRTLSRQTALDDETIAQLYLIGVTAWCAVNAACTIESSIRLQVVNSQGAVYTTQTPMDRMLAAQRRLIWLWVFSNKLWGKCFFLKKRNIYGYPTGLEWVSPLDIEAVPDYQTGLVHHYRITEPDRTYADYAPQDVIAYYTINPIDPLDGLSPYELVFKQVIAEDAIRDFVRAFFQNAARPDGMLSFSGTLTDNEKAQAQEDWEEYRGLDNAGKTFVATAKSGEWKWTPITAPMPDTGQRDNRIAIITDTCAVMQVLPVLTGLINASGNLGGDSSNVLKQAKLIQIELYSLPDVGILAETLTEQWAVEFNELEPYIIRPDEAAILSATQATTERSGVANTIFNQSLGTLNEARNMIGYGEAPEGVIQRAPAPILQLWDKGTITYGEKRRMLGLELDKPEWEHLRIWEIDPARRPASPPPAPPPSSRSEEPFFLRKSGEGAAILSLAYNPTLAEAAATLSGEVVPAEEWHCTLVMLDQMSDVQAQELAWALEGTANLALTITGWGSFELEDGGYAVHLALELDPALRAFQRMVAGHCTALGLGEFSTSQAYTPHITLAYTDIDPALETCPWAGTTVRPTMLTLSRQVGEEWQDLQDVPLAVTRPLLDDLSRWQKVHKKHPLRAFQPDALPDDVSDWIKLQLQEGWNSQVVFEAARSWLDTGIPPQPLGATREDYLRYWTTFDDLKPVLGDDFISYMAGLSQEAIWNALALFDIATSPLDAYSYALPAHKSEEQALLNEWAGSLAKPGDLANFVLAGASAGDALLRSALAIGNVRWETEPLTDVSWTLSPADAVKKAREYGATLIKDLNETTQAAIQELLAQAIEDGWRRDDLADALASVLALNGEPGDTLKNRAKLIAQTESVKAYNLGAFDRWKEAGIEESVWQTVRDGKVCPACTSLHGVVGDLTIGWLCPFDGNIYYDMAHPGCRCFRRPVVPGVDVGRRVIELPRWRKLQVA